MRVLPTAFAWLVLALTPAVASAEQILFSNFGPNSSFNPSLSTFFGFTEEQIDPSENFARAMSFVPTASGNLTTIEMPLEFPFFVHDWFQGGTLEVNLFASADGLPGQLLESFSSNGTPAAGTLSTFQSVRQPELVAGLVYFLEARAVGEANGAWFLTVPGLQEQQFRDIYRFGDGPWQEGTRRFEAAFRVSGDTDVAPVPEPASMILLGTGLAGMTLRRWRQKRA